MHGSPERKLDYDHRGKKEKKEKEKRRDETGWEREGKDMVEWRRNSIGYGAKGVG